MRINQLTNQEFQSTMAESMIDVTESAEPVVDIWPYVFELKKENVALDYVYNNQLVEKVYRNGLNTFDHVLLPTDDQNMFIVIVVDLGQPSIRGHYLLDLSKEYQISN